MADRQYGIPAGYREDQREDAPPQPPHHAPPQIFTPSSPYSTARGSPISRNSRTAGNAASAGAGAHDGPQDGYALRDIDNLYSYNPRLGTPSPGLDGPYADHSSEDYLTPRPRHQQTPSQSSLAPLAANQYMAAASTPPLTSNRNSRSSVTAGAAAGAGVAAMSPIPTFDAHMPRASYYHGDGYDYDPNSFADDGDDGLEEGTRSQGSHLAPAAAGAAGAGAGASMLKAFRSSSGGNYGPVGAQPGMGGSDPEKSAWLAKQSSGNKRWKWIIGIGIAILVVGGIIGGVVGGILSRNSSGGGSGSSSGSGGGGGSGSHSGGLYDIDSDEVQRVLGNKNLHRVFPAMDYTPNYAQYPQCLAKGGGPVQNNVTIDVAIMSQLTPAIRLYGTDCNQTELVMEAINLLQMNDTMKVWLGVYLDGNATTNDRQLAQLYDILDRYDHSSFVGAIIGNEVLYSQYLTATELQTQLENVRANFTARGIDLPVSTADLGDNWDATLAASSDIVMANIHPFFAGTVADAAAGWAYSFWNNKDLPLTAEKTGTVGALSYPKQIISEIGWPSQGGNDCGDATSDSYGCTGTADGAVASVANMNAFMSDWVCQANANGTTYFWFEAFDEPWKHQFDTAHNQWEPFWGLFDADRNLKAGLTIPSCGGKTVDRPY